MDLGLIINATPLWLVFLLTAALSLGAAETGARLARWFSREGEHDPDAPLGTITGAVLGLLGFMLAFTFGMTASRYDARKQLMLEQSNAIGAVYLKAGLLPKNPRQEARRLAKIYADTLVSGTYEQLNQILQQTEDIHVELWTLGESLVREDMDSDIRESFLDAVGRMIEAHESRRTVAISYRIPGSIWSAVYLLTLLSMMTMGYQLGMAGLHRRRGIPTMIAAFSLVIMMIAEMDRPGVGQFQVNQQSLVDVRQLMQRLPE